MKIALIGYGKMGKAIEKIAQQRGHEITSVVEDASGLEALLGNKPDVAIEFTQPESAEKNLSFCLGNNISVISGTTGWLDAYEALLSKWTDRNSAFLHASNFSVGVNLFFEMNEWLATKMAKLDFKCEIEEIHHTEKMDSPSGTAIKLAEGISRQNKAYTDWINEESTDHTKLGIISKRIPNVPGTHTVSYSSKMESIDIRHTAHDRSVFAEGAVMVAEWISGKSGVFTMSDFINGQ